MQGRNFPNTNIPAPPLEITQLRPCISERWPQTTTILCQFVSRAGDLDESKINFPDESEESSEVNRIIHAYIYVWIPVHMIHQVGGEANKSPIGGVIKSTKEISPILYTFVL